MLSQTALLLKGECLTWEGVSCSAGCTLPVEMFFPEEEYPTAAVKQELEQLGVLCSVLPELVPTYAVQNSSNSLNDTEGKRLAGFSMKSAAILLSSFEEVSLPLHKAILTVLNLDKAITIP